MNKYISKDKKISKIHILIFIGITIVTIGIPYLFYMKQEMDINHILFFNVILFVIIFTLIFMICSSTHKYINNVLGIENLLSFFIIYVISIIASSLFSFLPTLSWVFIPIAVSFLLFSNPFIALTATYCCLFISVFLTGTSYAIQGLYMLSILITILVFSKVKKIGHYYLAACISLCIHLALSFSYNILFLEGPLQTDAILYSILNFVIKLFFLLVAIRIADIFVLRKYDSIYTHINDQEYSLLKELKVKDEDTYLHAIHCAYFCDKISPKLNLNSSLVKAGTYYKNIGRLEKENSLKTIQEIAKENKFPKPVIALLEELYINDTSIILSKEACLIKITDEIIQMVERVLKKNSTVQLNIEELVEAIAMDLFTRKALDNSTFTFHEFEIVITFFKEEKLYYDFLR